MILFHGKSVDLQLSLAYGGSCVITSVVAQDIYSLSPYLYWIYDTLSLISNYVHHSWIASSLMMVLLGLNLSITLLLQLWDLAYN